MSTTHHTTIASQANEALPILSKTQYKKAINLLSICNDILMFEEDFYISATVKRLHQSIDHYLLHLPQIVEFEQRCYELLENEAQMPELAV